MSTRNEFDLTDLCWSDDEESRDLSPLRKRIKNIKGPMQGLTEGVNIKSEDCARLPTDINDRDDDDIEVVECKPAFTNAKTTGEDDGDVELVGFIGDRLPHVRCYCPDNSFVKESAINSSFGNAMAMEKNKLSCDLCYCYVCDKPAVECKEWSSHCMASDKGDSAKFWKNLRQQTKNSNNSSLLSFSGRDAECMSWSQRSSSCMISSTLRGPFHPDYQGAVEGLTKCRKCGWYSELVERNGSPSCSDWCHKCGRLASEEFYCNFKNERYEKEPCDVFIGRKIIAFTIHAHDPRQIDAYRKNWEENPDWQYNEAEMQEDAFHHRFGKYVHPVHVVKSVSVVDKIPSNGHFRTRINNELDGESMPVNLDGRKDISTLSISETEGIVLNTSSDLSLFSELAAFPLFGSNSGSQRSHVVRGDIESVWSKDTRKGKFIVTLYLKPNRMCEDRVGSVAKLLGVWFGAFPFAVTSLGRGLTATGFSSIGELERSNGYVIPVPPFRLLHHEQSSHLEEMKEVIEQKVIAFENHVRESRSKLTLMSSSGDHFMGGTVLNCNNDFKSFLKSYCSEMFANDLHDATLGCRGTWLAKKFGATSCHRDLKSTDTSDHLRLLDEDDKKRERSTYFTSYVESNDLPFIVDNLRTDATKLCARLRNVTSLIQHVENLGHDAVPYVEGLSIELLPFQKQSVQWALNRERLGVQSFLWTELPHIEDSLVNKLYMNPILNCVSSVKPKMVRGGLICEEIGLGKTIIALAIILANPAPLLPESGSTVPDTFKEHQGERHGWDSDLRASIISDQSDKSGMEEENLLPPPNKRGSILSRGTLVVCHVSLVGQWCEEARSKLKDPGLVYAFHGSGRIRNPHVLAKNGIVVTTYATLSSDANYHAKGKDDDYCAPCEQIRWWRIICDESHTIRSSNTKQSKAVMALVADHKWAVTGTPVNTTLFDLKNQLKFIGIEHVNTYFKIFDWTAFRFVKDPGVKGSCFRPQVFGDFVFFLRNVMIRHTKAQRYKGINTDLMALPIKTERTMTITLTSEEREEYAALEREARKSYTIFKFMARNKLHRYYLALWSGLKAMRCACSGGRFPLFEVKNSLHEFTDTNATDDDPQNEGEESPKRGKKAELKYSDFVFTSKLRVLIDELTRNRDEDPGSKSLVFSNFSSTLKWLQEELPKHGFKCRHIDGQMPQRQREEALAAFQNDPPTTVFLLSMRSSNCGINLTSANRVFLLEPALNPATVQQAVGRVHRLGQQRPVEIIRMIIEDSIETKLTALLESKYGTSTVTTTDVPDSNVEGNTNNTPNFIGSLSTDKASVSACEFDFLYGVT